MKDQPIITTVVVDNAAKRQLTAKIEDQLKEAAELLDYLRAALPEGEEENAEVANENIIALLKHFHPAKRKAAK